MHGIPLKIGTATANAVVDISKDISGRDVEYLALRFGKLATVDKMLMSITRFGRNGQAEEVLAKSISLRPLVSRSDHWFGLGYAQAAQVSAAILDGTNPVAALDAAVIAIIDIGRHNLRTGEKLNISFASTSAFSSESFKALALECRPGMPERVLKFSQVSPAQPVTSNVLREAWLYEIVGQSLAPYASSDGDLVISVGRGGETRACELAELFIATAASGNYEVGEPAKAALIYEDRAGTKLETPTISTAGASQSYVQILYIESVLDAQRAVEDKRRVVDEHVAKLSRLEKQEPRLAQAMRATFNLPHAAEIRR